MLHALILAAVTGQTHLSLEPWHGKDLQVTTSAAVKYRLLVTGTPNATVRLTTSGVANGWIAAFCTPKVCAPSEVDVTLPASGQAEYQFELIKEDDHAAKSSGARIVTSDGVSIDVR